jgi:hypothetical protein
MEGVSDSSDCRAGLSDNLRTPGANQSTLAHALQKAFATKGETDLHPEATLSQPKWGLLQA